MNRLTTLIITVAMLLTGISTSANIPEGTDSRLRKQWDTYSKAMDGDLPVDAAAALKEIMDKAAAIDAPWDFYNAGRLYVSARGSRSWKDRQSAEQEVKQATEAYGSVIIRFVSDYQSFMSKDASDPIRESDALKNGFHPQFYREISAGVFTDIVRDSFKSDYDYALWYAFSRRSHEMADFMKKRYAGSYPMGPVVEYYLLDGMDYGKSEAALRGFVAQYRDKAVSLPASAELLYRKFQATEVVPESSPGFKSIRESADSLVRLAASYTGEEKKIAACETRAAGLVEILDSRSVTCFASNCVAKVSLKNVKSCNLEVIRDGKTVWSGKAQASKNLFYVPEEISMNLPSLPDGSYKLKCTSPQADSYECDYERFTISFAIKLDSGGMAAFAADYMTGEPVTAADVHLSDRNGKVLASVKDFRMPDGFAYLPEDITSRLSPKREMYLQFSIAGKDGQKRLSPRRQVWKRDTGFSDEDYRIRRVQVLTDCGAYNPGDTVRYKAIAYGGSYDLETVGKGKPMVVTLYDADRNPVQTVELSTDDFGAAAGEFVLPSRLKGGMWHVEAGVLNGEAVGMRWMRADEFVLPTYTVEWEKNTRRYLPGDTISIRGCVKSFSGHKLSDARASYSLKGSSDPQSGKLELDGEGNFELNFKASSDNWASYTIDVTITDGTGETLEFSTSAQSSSYLDTYVSLANPVNGRFSSDKLYGQIVSSDEVIFLLSRKGYDNLKAHYVLSTDGKVVEEADTDSDRICFNLAAGKSSCYALKIVWEAVSDNGKTFSRADEMQFVRVSDNDPALNFDAVSFFKDMAGDDLAIQVGTTSGATWVIAELYAGDVMLDHRTVRLKGEKGRVGSLATVSFERKPSYEGVLTVRLLFFKKGASYSYERRFEPKEEKFLLPLKFTRFTDTTRPGEKCTVMIATAPDVQCAATVYDASTESINPNGWNRIYHPERPVRNVSYDVTNGYDRTDAYDHRIYVRGLSKSAMAANAVTFATADTVEEEMVEIADYSMAMDGEAPAAGGAEPAVRENFLSTIAWEPFLRSDASGNITFDFTAGDKLSTYIVQLFAHDRSMNSQTLRRNVMVTIPVKVAVVQPRYLYDGDIYSVRVTVSNNGEDAVAGKLAVEFYDGDWKGARPVRTVSSDATVQAGGSCTLTFSGEEIRHTGDLGMLVRFDTGGDTGTSDAVFVKMPVHRAVQSIVEAHSTLLRSGDDKEAAEARLRSLFQNIDGRDASVSEISIRGMLAEALPGLVKPRCDNSISYTEAIYSSGLAASLKGSAAVAEPDTADKLRKCINSDGGFAWLEGMYSSAMVTATILERCADSDILRDLLGDDVVKAAVSYLDGTYFKKDRLPAWCGGISFEQYLHVRSRFAAVPFDVKDADADRLSDFRGRVKDYLVPGKVRGLNGSILLKARRVQTLRNLVSSDSGIALARKWGVRLFSGRRMARAIHKDVTSLLQYAVEHDSGGWYFPNAVHGRGLLEGELYAHSLLCNLLGGVALAGGDDFGTPSPSEVADGIRLWMMVQKETQKWETDPAYVEALSCVLHGSEALLETRVMVLRGEAVLPFADVKAAGNGMAVKCSWYLGDRELAPGDSVHVGDRISARYVLTNDENRSFVRLVCPRPASFRPVEQLSGIIPSWGVYRLDGGFVYRPQGYRNVYSDRTEYSFGSFAEGGSRFSEDFFVSQEGRFQTPAVWVESQYAPHYRANDDGRPALVSLEKE